MNLQYKSIRLYVVFFAVTIFFLFSNYVRAQKKADMQSLEGLWLADGYGMLVEFQGDDLRSYEITALSCMASEKATRKTEASTVNEIVFTGDDDIFRIFPGKSLDTRWLHIDG